MNNSNDLKKKPQSFFHVNVKLQMFKSINKNLGCEEKTKLLLSLFLQRLKVKMIKVFCLVTFPRKKNNNK